MERREDVEGKGQGVVKAGPVRGISMASGARVGMVPGADPPFHVGATIGNCFINTIEFIYPWNSATRVTSVPVGERFDFVVNYRAENLSPELGTLAGFWSVCIVWWDSSGDTSLDGWYFKSSVGTGATVIADNGARIANAYSLIMPNHPVTLMFNMFINDDMTPAQQYPNRADWAALRT